MSEVAQGPDWQQGFDGKWYPPGTQPTAPPGSGLPSTYAAAPVTQYCRACGYGLIATAAMCPRCGTPVSGVMAGPSGGKSRTAAVLLAVFLSFWSFLYTYGSAAWKFWLGLGLNVFGLVVAVTAVAGHTPEVALLWYLISFGVWVWAIVDRSTTPL